MVTQVPARNHIALALMALGAALALLVSLAVTASPVLAEHSTDGPAVAPTTIPFTPGEPVCPPGTTPIRFTWSDSTDLNEVFDGSTKGGVTLTDVDRDAGLLILFEVGEVEGEQNVAVLVYMKGGPLGQNLYNYSTFPAGGVAHDDDLVTPSTPGAAAAGISHIDFCIAPAKVGSLLILKTDDGTPPKPLDGASFLVEDSEGTDVATGKSGDDGTGTGLFCVDDLEPGEYTVTETAAPAGYDRDSTNPRKFTVVESDDCAARIEAKDGPDLTFVNKLKPVTQAPPPATGGVGAGTGTPAVQIPDTTAEGSGMWGALAPVLFTLILLGSLGANAYLHLQRARRRNA